MGDVVWHIVKDYDFPQPFKEVLILDDMSRFKVGWYEGETRKLPWHLVNVMDVSSKHVQAWCELPNIPYELMNKKEKL